MGEKITQLSLSYPVVSLERELLLKEGTSITRDVMEELVFNKTDKIFPRIPFNNFRYFEQDLISFISEPPYNAIFSNRQDIKALLADIEKAEMPLPFFEALNYFRHNELRTYRHQLTVYALSLMLAKDMMLSRDEYKALLSCGPVHDIGKVTIPLDILKKSTPLTTKERTIVDNHTAAGYVLFCYYCQSIDTQGSRVARDHHERIDKSGKPRGILLQDRIVEIVSACDIYDALVSARPFRPQAFDNRQALDELTSMAEQGSISWNIVKALIARNRKKKTHYKDCKPSLEKRGVSPKVNHYGILSNDPH